MRLQAFPAVLLLSAAACSNGGSSSSSSSSSTGAPPVYQESVGLKACKDAILEAGKPLEPGQRCFTYRAIGGVSMGGGSAARIGFHYPELFDAVGIMGTPFSDFDYFYNMLATNHLSGFCTREQLLAVLAANPGHPEVLDDPAVLNVWCGQHGADIPGDLALPDTQCYAFRSDYNHWYRGPDEGRGGGFKRNGLVEIMQDMASVYGNVSYYNPDNPYLPPGVPLSMRIDPAATGADRDAQRAQICSHPLTLNNFKHHLWNPDGSFPVITYCECGSCDGDLIKGAELNIPMEVALAVDYNGNGRRDYGEPVIYMGHEVYLDVGLDGKETGAAGDDPTDEYHYLTNPNGKAHNSRYDLGEPFEDNGLDGIPLTGDFGEGDGLFTMTPPLEHALNDSPTRWYQKMSDKMVDRVDIWMDAGIRDFINSAQITNNLFGAIKARTADSRYYRDFSDLGHLAPGRGYSFTQVDFSKQNIGKNAYLLYGNPAFCPGSDFEMGSGNHVGPANVVIDRLLTLFAFVDARMPGGDRSYINSSSAADDHPDGFSAHLKLLTFDSTVLGRPLEYGLILPPGYYYPENANKRYPVIYFLHGQGMNASGLVATGVIFMAYMFQAADASVLDRSDMQKFILVFADGECKGADCHTGNFYSDFVGTNNDGKKFEQSFLELMRVVDANNRTRLPEVH